MQVFCELPLDLQKELLRAHYTSYHAARRFVLEAVVSVRADGTYRDGGLDDIWGDVIETKIPLVQRIYNSGTGTWHKPGRLMHSPLINKTSEYINENDKATYTEVGYGAVPEHSVRRMLRAALKSKRYQAILDSIRQNTVEGADLSRGWSFDWRTEYRLEIRVREILKAGVGSAWVFNNPVYSRGVRLCDSDKVNPYPFETFPCFHVDFTEENATKMWVRVMACLQSGESLHEEFRQG